jgi:phospholipid transport system substrate-binding protein
MQLADIYRKLVAIVLLGLALSAAASANVAAQSETPHEVIARTTDQMLALVTDAKLYYEQEPDRYYDQVAEIIAPIMDFKTFARAVMGQHGSKKYYQSLATEQDRLLFSERLSRFTIVFQESLVKTYGQGLLAFGGEKIEILSGKLAENARSAVVTQIIHNDTDKPFRIDYKLARNKEGVWKLRNVLIQGVNIGKVYRSQFSSAAKKYQGDIDQVIENWSVIK